MIEESILLYLERKISMTEDTKEKLHQLLRCRTPLSLKNPLKKNQKLQGNRKKLEHIDFRSPLWSRAFPMGVLEKMVELLDILDPQNMIWKEIHALRYPACIEMIDGI